MNSSSNDYIELLDYLLKQKSKQSIKKDVENKTSGIEEMPLIEHIENVKSKEDAVDKKIKKKGTFSI